MIKQFIQKVINLNIGFESFFVLYCLYHKDKTLIYEYVTKCKKINTEIFKSLESDGYLLIDDPEQTNKITFELLSLTEKGFNLIRLNDMVLSDPATHNSVSNFEGFRKFYPTLVKDGLKERRLQGNVKRCKALYDKLLAETTHDILCKCAEIYTNIHKKSGDSIYMQNLETWLNQKTYQLYLEDVEKETNNQVEEDQSADI